MSSFDDREKAFENKYAHDAQMQFKVEARRNKLLGLWAAGKMGLAGNEAETYAKTVVVADLEEAGDEDVFRKVSGDLSGKADEGEIRDQMRELLATAKVQIMEELN